MKGLNLTFCISLLLITLASVYSARLLSIAPAIIFIFLAIHVVYLKYLKNDRISFPQWHHCKLSIITIGAIIVLGAISILWSVFPELSSKRVLKILPLFVLGLGYFYLLRIIRGNNLGLYLFFGLVIACLVMQIDMYFDFGFYRFTRGISPDAYFLPSELNRAVCFLTLLTLVAANIVKSKLQLAAIFLSYYLVFLYTESQTAQLGFLVGLTSFVMFKLFKQRVIYMYLAILVLCTLPLPWAIPAVYENRPDNPGVYLTYAANGYSRLEIWDGTARLIQEKPILGYGIGTFRDIELDMENIYHPDDKILHPHNISLQIWAEFGAVGIFIFLILNAWLLKRVTRMQPPTVQNISLSIWSAVMAMGLTGYGLWQGWWLGMIVLITGIILYYEQQDQGEN